MAPVITLLTTTGEIGAAFTITGTGFGASQGLVLIYPNTEGTASPIGPFGITWSATSITGTIPNFLLAPVTGAYFVVIPLNEIVGTKTDPFDLLPEAVVPDATFLISGQFITTAAGTAGDPQAVLASAQGDVAGQIQFVDVGENTVTAKWANDVTVSDDYEQITIARSAAQVRGFLTMGYQQALGNHFYDASTFIIE